MSFWYSRPIRTTTAFRQDGNINTGYVVRSVLRITKGAKSVVGRDVELHLTVAEARELALELNARADVTEQYNKGAGYLI